MTPKPKIPMSKIKPGVGLLIRMYNDPEGIFYGEFRKGEVLEVAKTPGRSKRIIKVRLESGYDMWIRHWEARGFATIKKEDGHD